VQIIKGFKKECVLVIADYWNHLATFYELGEGALKVRLGEDAVKPKTNKNRKYKIAVEEVKIKQFISMTHWGDELFTFILF